MTREHLFRGLRKDGEGWIFGDLSHNFMTDTPYITERGVISGEEVIDKTIGEWSGLYDKNGKRIFEGDIVRSEPPFDFKENGVVLWVNHDQAFVVCVGGNENFHYGDLGNFDDGKCLEVTGTIHDEARP